LSSGSGFSENPSRCALELFITENRELRTENCGSAFPAIGIFLGQSYMREHAVREFLSHYLDACGMVIEGWDERKDGCAGIGGKRHVADVNFVERRLADAEHERPSLFKSYVGGAFDQARGGAVGNAAECSDAARDHDHGIGRIWPVGG